MASSKKKQSKRVPKSLRKGGLPRSVGDVWTAGVGALAQARTAGGQSFEALVALGAAVAETGSKAAQRAVGQVETAAGVVTSTARGLAEGAAGELEDGVEGAVETVLSRLGVPGRDEVLALREQVDALQARLATLSGRPAGGARARTDGEPADATTTVPMGTEPPEDERTVYRVMPHERGWMVQRAGTERAASVHPTKKAAVHQARQTARAHAPSRLAVHRADGTVGQETDYDA